MVHDLGMEPVPTPPAIAPPRRITLDAIRLELLAGCSPGAQDQQLLVEVAASAAALLFKIEGTAVKLAEVLPASLSDSRQSLALAKILGAVVELQSTLARRIDGCLQTGAALRAQRRLGEGAGR